MDNLVGQVPRDCSADECYSIYGNGHILSLDGCVAQSFDESWIEVCKRGRANDALYVQINQIFTKSSRI